MTSRAADMSAREALLSFTVESNLCSTNGLYNSFSAFLIFRTTFHASISHSA